ncbi:MAG: hypothetical protein K0R91_743 [Nitrososphaeraceae archaeon]|nr:hypothetical protein [Nitrososphaeraceae archaeon]
MSRAQEWAVILLVTILFLAVSFPQGFAAAFGQIATLAPGVAPPPSTSPTTTPQCVDFTQDGICEFIVLVNGTMIKNPNPNPVPIPAASPIPVHEGEGEEDSNDNDDNDDNDYDDDSR